MVLNVNHLMMNSRYCAHFGESYLDQRKSTFDVHWIFGTNSKLEYGSSRDLMLIMPKRPVP